MILIGNNCSSGFTYRKLNKEYNHPFIWSCMDATNMLKLIDEFDSINWFNVSIHPAYKPGNMLTLIIDKKIYVDYPHIKLDAAANVPYIANTPSGNDVMCNSPWEYCINKYIARVKRMLTSKEPIEFLISAAPWTITENDIENIYKHISAMALKYPITILSTKQYQSKQNIRCLQVQTLIPENQATEICHNKWFTL